MPIIKATLVDRDDIPLMIQDVTRGGVYDYRITLFNGTQFTLGGEFIEGYHPEVLYLITRHPENRVFYFNDALESPGLLKAVVFSILKEQQHEQEIEG